MGLLLKHLNGINMRVIKLGLISVVVFFVLFTLGGLLLPSHNIVSRAVNIKAKPTSILPLVQNKTQWHLWIEGMDNATLNKRQQVKIIEVSDSLVVANWKTAEANYTTKFRLIYNLGQGVTIVQWQFEQDVYGSWKLRVEKADYFFNSNAVVHSFPKVGQIVQSAMSDKLVNNIKIGYSDKFKNIAVSALTDAAAQLLTHHWYRPSN
jgi:hypothetical protein